MTTIKVAAIITVLAIQSILTAEVRNWTQESTGRKISGEFIKMQDEKTAVIKINDRDTPIPLTMLIQADQDLIAKLNAPADKTPTTKPKVPAGETVVVLSGVALNCSTCEKNAETAISHERYGLKNPGAVTVKADKKAGTLTITAQSGKDAQLALNCLNKLGFYGTSDNEAVKIAPFKKGDLETTTMLLRGVNVACGGCVRDVKKILKSVDGVKKFTIKEVPKGDSRFQIEGNFKPIEVIQALREKGYGGYYQ